MRRNRLARMVGEFLVIVVGVLAALAVDQSRSWKADRDQERLYLEGLAFDLDGARASLQFVSAHYAGVLESGPRVLPVLERTEEFPLDTLAFLLALYDPARSVEPTIPRATYADILSTGSLRLFRDDALRREIVDYYESIASIVAPTDYEVDRAPYRRAVRSLLPLDIQAAIRTCGPPQYELASRLETCRSAFAELPLSRALDRVLAHAELGSDLTLSLQSAATGRFDSAETATEDLARAVEAALGAS